jgi:hypothetical protein
MPGRRRAQIAFSDSAAKQLENLTDEHQIHALDRALVAISVDPEIGEPIPGDTTHPELHQHADEIERVRVLYFVTALRTVGGNSRLAKAGAIVAIVGGIVGLLTSGAGALYRALVSADQLVRAEVRPGRAPGALRLRGERRDAEPLQALAGRCRRRGRGIQAALPLDATWLVELRERPPMRRVAYTLAYDAAVQSLA